MRHAHRRLTAAALALAVVVVSDAEDQSNQPVSYYENLLINVKGFNRLSMFTFSNIGPYLPNPPSNCSYDGDGDPQRYMALVQATSGVQDEICTTNWATALQGLGRTAFGFRTQFFLNTTPWMIPEPSRICGKMSLPLERML